MNRTPASAGARQPRLAGAALAVLLLHGAAWFALRRLPEAPPMRPSAVPIRWFELAQRVPPRGPAPAAANPPSAEPEPRRSSRTATAPTPTTGVPRLAPAGPDAQSTPPLREAAAGPPAPAASPAIAPPLAPPPLDLRWHPERAAVARSPARDDPRANTAAASPAERFARTLGSDDRLHEEQRGDGGVRLRRGTDCIDATTTRAAALFAFDAATRPQPRLISGCD